MEYAIAVLVLLSLVALVVARPLLRGESEEHAELQRRQELDAARDAKYREIREAELDRRTGKLAEDDWRVIDRELRAEAVAILRELDELG
jgi:type II secretory pathway component PulM